MFFIFKSMTRIYAPQGPEGLIFWRNAKRRVF